MAEDGRISRRDVAGLSLGALAGLAAARTAHAAPAEPAPRAPAASGAVRAIAYSKFRLYTAVDADLDHAPTFPFPFIEGSKFRAVNTGIDEPAVQVNYEDFLPGPDIVWSMFHDEVQYVTSGRAEITFHLPPLMQETGKVVAGPGSIYLLPRGARIVWKVLGDRPFRHLCICIPNPGYPIPVAASARGA
jgi:mannose-6-phosphate isomerase-like protein (cupin superfamily)